MTIDTLMFLSILCVFLQTNKYTVFIEVSLLLSMGHPRNSTYT